MKIFYHSNSFTCLKKERAYGFRTYLAVFRCFLSVILCIPGLIGFAQTPLIENVQNTNGWVNVAQATGSGQMNFPRAFSFEYMNSGVLTKKILINWQTSSDAVQILTSHSWKGTIDGGANWNAPGQTNTSNTGDFDLMAPVRRNTDGVLFTLPFFWGAGNTPPLSIVYHTSTDNGNTWTRMNTGSISGFPAGQTVGGFRWHRGIIQDADGTMYAPAHGEWTGSSEPKQVMLMKSTNGGTQWTYVSTIQYTSNINYNETTIARCKDNSILAIMRNVNVGTYISNGLKYKRSTDNGATWGPIFFVPGLPTNEGVDPILEMLPNGILTLSYGNEIYHNQPYGRNCMLAFSPDGNGNNWVSATQTFESVSPVSLTAKNRSSAYTSLIPLKTNRFLQFSDRGDPRYYSNPTNPNPNPNPHSIWSKAVEVVLNYRNRIDLKTKYANGQVAVTTDLTYANATHPMARVEGAFDANTYYWNGAFKQASTGTFTIDLLQDQRLNALAICLLKGRPQTADIEWLPDGGSTWTMIKQYAGATHHTVDYISFAEIKARYIRVTFKPSAATIIGINEIALFSSVDTYEDYAYGLVPQGYTAPNAGFKVTEGVTPFPSGYQSTRALYLEDIDATNKELRKTYPGASTNKTFEFRIRTKTFASSGAVQWRILSGTTNAFRMRVTSANTVQYLNGSTYVTIPGLTIPLDTWTSVKVTANTSTGTGTISINGGAAQAIGKETTVASLDGILFASSGATATGDRALFDDVILYDTPAAPLMQQSLQSSDMAVSPALLTETESSTGFVISAFPNPASRTFNLNVTHPSRDKINIRIVDIAGVEVKKAEYAVTGNKASVFEISLENLPSGIYIIQAKQGNEARSTKLIVK